MQRNSKYRLLGCYASEKGGNMNEQDYHKKTTEENLIESDKLFLEYAVKKCSLTLSKEEILSRTQWVLNELPGENEEENSPQGKEHKIDLVTDVYVSPESEPDKSDEVKSVTEVTDENVSEKQRKKKKAIFGDLLFYGVLVALIVGAILLTGNGGQGPRSFAGFTAQTVLTSSMESVYPKGSLVISQRTDPNTLEIGDDITFMTSETTTVTHRIIGIVENYAETEQRAFQTQGVMNQNPDSQLVPAVNVVGKVVFHSYAAGRIVDFVKNTWPLLLFFLVLLTVLIRVLKYIYRKDDGKTDNAEKKKKPKVKRGDPVTQ